jgi:fructose-specific phosphotransferase system IIC component
VSWISGRPAQGFMQEFHVLDSCLDLCMESEYLGFTLGAVVKFFFCARFAQGLRKVSGNLPCMMKSLRSIITSPLISAGDIQILHDREV